MSDNAAFLLLMAGLVLLFWAGPIVTEAIKLACTWLRVKRERLERSARP